MVVVEVVVVLVVEVVLVLVVEVLVVEVLVAGGVSVGVHAIDATNVAAATALIINDLPNDPRRNPMLASPLPAMLASRRRFWHQVVAMRKAVEGIS